MWLRRQPAIFITLNNRKYPEKRKKPRPTENQKHAKNEM